MSSQNFFTNVSFCYPFRDYQSRVLRQIEDLLDDQKLHIVAAPGSGKTVLGLEVIRRLNRKTLILVPTINLRNQWKERFFDLFLPVKDKGMREKWEQEFSMDLKTPKTITCSTYQTLYHLYREKQEEGEDAFKVLANTYREFGIQTICLDEAHHLKQEWWRALTVFVQSMNVKLISLTATPPIDTSDLEWKRYIELCGDIDLEISIPEMVVKKCLCPHQDYLYLCRPTREEQSKVDNELLQNSECQKLILRDKDLYQAIKQLPFLIKPSEYTTLLVKHPNYLEHVVNYAAYIQEHYHIELEGSMTDARKAFNKWDYRIRHMVIGMTPTSVDDWFLPLMQDILEKNPEHYPESLREKLTAILKKNHFLRNGKVSAYHTSANLERTLLHSASKLDAIADIVQAESVSMGQELRCLILMDHIRKEDLKKVATDEPLTDLGVSTVFERLRRQEHLGNLEKFFEPETNKNRTSQRTYRTRMGVLTGSLIVLPNDIMQKMAQEYDIKNVKPIGVTGYSMLDENANSTDKLSLAVTDYFQQGMIEILIGTAALLGEGWDAPAVNTLIIGSTSAMYVKTNQMRGRALRMNPKNPEKVSNVWHLMSVTTPLKKSPEYRAMQQRFEAVPGLSMDGTRVENGIGRLSDENQRMEDLQLWNSHMKKRSLDRLSVKKAWETIELEHGDSQVRNVVVIEDKPDFRSHTRWLKKRQLIHVANAITATLKERKLIHTSVVLKYTQKGNELLFYLESASEHDSQLFASCMKQVASSLDAPKYMIRIGFFSRRYFTVPDVLATRKEIATTFCDKMGFGTKLLYVRTKEGALQLLNEKIRQNTAEKRSVAMIKELM